ncbi:MAG TPA: hypothetical protein VH575_13715 [Gemmataceae bacterium]|jgi:predicted DNA-binding transcriptional regulator AlpA
MSATNTTAAISPKISTSRTLAILGVTEVTLAALRKRPDFPRPYRYSTKGRLLWDEAEIRSWMESQRETEAVRDA